MRLTLAALIVICLAPHAGADDGIPAETLRDLKAATVMVKVAADGARGSGSGFIVAVDGETAYLVTNEHVVRPPALRGRVTVQVVLHSGRAGSEQTADAEVVAEDRERDLAVLRARKVKGLPKPLNISDKPAVTETMTVYALGFPFGEALSTTDGNPAITIGRGTVSSLRENARGEVVLVQIDGDINPGNSGGPVVDAKGRLVGVAVAKVRGTNIGLAVPQAELAAVLAGRAEAPVVRPGKAADGKVEVELEVPLTDPLGKVRSVGVRVLRKADLPADWRKPADAPWPALPGAVQADLTVGPRAGTGTVTLKSAKPQVESYLFQTVYTLADGKAEVRLEPKARDISFDPSKPSGTGEVSFRMYGDGELFVRHRHSQGQVTALESDLDRKDGTFKMVPGLSDPDGVSFESVNYPKHYLRHAHYRIVLSEPGGDPFSKDATFKQVKGLADPKWVSFESVNYPGYFIRQKGGVLWIDKADRTDAFARDATFGIVDPAAGRGR